MDIDSKIRQRGEFPVDQPLEALKTDHRFVRELFEEYFRTQDEDERKDLGGHILALVEMHADLEENAFYPRVRDADPSLVAHCEDDHAQARQLVEGLKPMDAASPQAETLFRQLADAVLRHVDEEEQQLFPKIAQANLDMAAIGSEMQAFEVRLIAARNQRPVTPGLRP